MGRSVIVVGGGPAGLAVAVSARRRGLHCTVLDRDIDVGASWGRRYARLHLHTPRGRSRLPGARIPRRYGRWVARDDLVRYLQDYARDNGVQPIQGVEVVRVDPSPDGEGWQVTTSQGVRPTGRVVIATGYNNVPYVPDWPGMGGFAGELLHSVDYLEPSPYVGQRVLVVGAGNSGAEIATDLATGGAAEVYLSVRTPPHILPRSVLGVPTAIVSAITTRLPDAVSSTLSRVVARLTMGDLTRYGMPAPQGSVVEYVRRTDVIPILDAGFVAQLREGRIHPVPEVVGFDGYDVLLGREHGQDGEAGAAADAAGDPAQRLRVDTVIAATGFRTGLEPVVGHLGVLDARGRPVVTGAVSPPDHPGLYFVGLSNPLSGILHTIRREAAQVGRVLASSRSTDTSPRRTSRA